MARRITSGMVVEGILAVLVLAILLVAQMLHSNKAAKAVPTPTPITKVVVTTAPQGSSLPSVTPVANLPSFIYGIAELDLMFAVPGELRDLVHASIRISQNQTQPAVAFSTTRLATAGCPTSEAPLGVISFDAAIGGVEVAKVAGRSVYYLEPTSACKADTILLPKDAFKAATKSLISNQEPPKNR